MLRNLLTTVIVGINVAASYSLYQGDMNTVIMLSVFGLFTNEAIKLIYPSTFVIKGVLPNGRQ